MLTLVHDQRLLVRESFSAIVAKERLLSSMLAFVAQQLDTAAVIFSAEIAHVRVLTAVQALMHQHVHLEHNSAVAMRRNA